MSERHPSTSPQKAEVLEITTQLSEAFLDERPGWTENYLRKVAAAWLKAVEADESRAFEANTVTAELTANAVKYGRAASHLAVVYTAPGENSSEAIGVVASNPARDKTDTPGTKRRGKLASRQKNARSQHGRGLWMTHVYTNGNWGQRNVESPDGEREIVTFAVLSDAQETGSDSTSYKGVA